MTGLDTNVPIAWVLEGQARPVPGKGPYRVSRVVLAEFIWLLRRSLKTPKPDLLDLLTRMRTLHAVRFDKPDAVAAAIKDWADDSADLSDYLRMRDHRSTAADETPTMDRRAAAHPGFTLLA